VFGWPGRLHKIHWFSPPYTGKTKKHLGRPHKKIRQISRASHLLEERVPRTNHSAAAAPIQSVVAMSSTTASASSQLIWRGRHAPRPRWRRWRTHHLGKGEGDSSSRIYSYQLGSSISICSVFEFLSSCSEHGLFRGITAILVSSTADCFHHVPFLFVSTNSKYLQNLNLLKWWSWHCKFRAFAKPEPICMSDFPPSPKQQAYQWKQIPLYPCAQQITGGMHLHLENNMLLPNRA
jgi:hypothetical protein